MAMDKSNPLVVANWKMHGDGEFVDELLTQLTRSLGNQSDINIAICPPFPYLTRASQQLQHSLLKLGAQDISDINAGARTSEVSASMVRDCGCDYVLVGHSERRQYAADSSQKVADKFAMAIKEGLQPILCIGEDAINRQQGKTLDCLRLQLEPVIAGNGIEALTHAILAYEPIWAIGSGTAATVNDVLEVGEGIKNLLTGYNMLPDSLPRLLYGGSVVAANAGSFVAHAGVSGLLVGGASLQAESFTTICQQVAQSWQKKLA